MTTLPLGTCIPPGTTEPAAMRHQGSMRQLSSRIDPMPTSTSSPTSQPCRITRWPTVTRAPMRTVEKPPVAWAMVPSCRFVSSPTTMAPWSPRRTTVGHTLTFLPSVMSPIRTAEGWIQAVGSMLTVRSSRGV